MFTGGLDRNNNKTPFEFHPETISLTYNGGLRCKYQNQKLEFRPITKYKELNKQIYDHPKTRQTEMILKRQVNVIQNPCRFQPNFVNENITTEGNYKMSHTK